MKLSGKQKLWLLVYESSTMKHIHWPLTLSIWFRPISPNSSMSSSSNSSVEDHQKVKQSVSHTFVNIRRGRTWFRPRKDYINEQIFNTSLRLNSWKISSSLIMLKHHHLTMIWTESIWKWLLLLMKISNFKKISENEKKLFKILFIDMHNANKESEILSSIRLG